MGLVNLRREIGREDQRAEKECPLAWLDAGKDTELAHCREDREEKDVDHRPSADLS